MQPMSSHLRKTQDMTMNQEPPNSFSTSAFEEKTQEITMNLSTCHHLLHLRKKLRNDNKPFGSLSFAIVEKENKKMTMS
jgi:ssRNA-specific RNase YbeY (16S rRNA maturation enzyme)